jgi:hypothetical protein
MKRLFAIVILAIFFSTFAAADTIHVPQDQPNIQAGINASVNGDTVLVEDNTYYENISFKGRAIVVASHFIVDGDTNHINNTIIDGSKSTDPDSGSTVYFISAEDTNSVLTGFTITGGKGTYVTYDFYNDIDGGGIYIYDSGAKIEYNKITDNHLATEANDLYCGGAGIFGLSRICNLVIRGNEISNNSATATGNAQSFAAGAIVTTEATCIVENNRIQNNELSTPSSTFAFAAGLMVDGWDRQAGNYIVRNNIIHNNRLDPENNGGGGGMVIQNCSPLVYNNIISGNRAHNGGGVWVIHYKAIAKVAPKPRLINNTIINNSAIEFAGGIMMGSSPESCTYLMNNIVAYNTGIPPYDQVIRQGGAGRMVRNCIIEGADYGESNIAADPLLIADSLTNESPAIGAGIFEYDFGDGVVLQSPPNDINGRERPCPAGTNPDIGAWESKYNTPSGVNPQQSIKTPMSFKLEQNYPNPFNPVTTICYELPMSSDVSLNIYNVNGQLIETLVDAHQDAGTYSVQWTAIDASSGIYLYKLIAGDYTEVRKCMLLR